MKEEQKPQSSSVANKEKIVKQEKPHASLSLNERIRELRLKFLENQAKKHKAASTPIELDSKLPKLNPGSQENFVFKKISNKEISINNIGKQNGNGSFKIPKIKKESDTKINEPAKIVASSLMNFKIPKVKKEPDANNDEIVNKNTTELSKNGSISTEQKHLKLEPKDGNENRPVVKIEPKSTSQSSTHSKEKPKSSSSIKIEPINNNIKKDTDKKQSNSDVMNVIKIEPINLDENTPKSTNSDTNKKESVEQVHDKADKHV